MTAGVMERFRLDDKIALVTGAGRGIGEGCARGLAEAGAEVILMSRTGAELDKLETRIVADGGRARTVVCDVTDTAAVKALVPELGPIDVLVNNAGTNVPEPFVEVTEETYDRIMNLNVRAVFMVSQAVAKTMIERSNGGSIIHISSQMGHVGAPNRTVYSASKHATEGLTKAMAWDLAPHGIRVNAVAPTFIETPMTRPFLDDKAFVEDTLSRIALGRFGQPQDVAAAVVYLASLASDMVTGTSLLVDGGWTAR
jgi:NAD(P)-dependent dehydrogenase (short-subunit alcohol dehydrogenase family)